MENRLVAGITQGDVNSVAYELIIKLLAENRMNELCTPVLYGSPKVAAYYRKTLNVENFSLNGIKETTEANPRRVNIINCVDDNVKVDLGKETPDSNRASMDALKYALDQLDKKTLHTLLISPQGKGSYLLEGSSTLTDYLAKRYEMPEAMPLYVNTHMRVAFVTDQVKLCEVSNHITLEAISKKLRLLHDCLRFDFTISKPKIAVLALNPQAGEEETKVLVPAIEQARQKGIMALGPFAADYFFAERMYQKFDAVLAMYQDQGMIPFKSLEVEPGAVYVMGLPVVCTYALNDTGYNKVGQNVTDEQSFRNAFYLGMDVYAHRQRNKELHKNPLPHYDIAVNSNESDLNVEQIEGVQKDSEEVG